MTKRCRIPYRLIYGLTMVLCTVWSTDLGASNRLTVHGEEIQEAVRDYIAENMPWDPGDIRLEFSQEIDDVTVECDDDVTCRVTQRRNENFIGNTYFTVGVFEGNTRLEKRTVRVGLRVRRDVVVADRYIERGTVLSDDDVLIMEKWFTRIPANIFCSIDDVIGKKLSTRVYPRTELRRTMLRERIAVKRGKIVRIVLEKGPMRITTVGLSEESGAEGDVIKVKNISSEKSIYAQVMSDSEVRITY